MLLLLLLAALAASASAHVASAPRVTAGRFLRGGFADAPAYIREAEEASRGATAYVASHRDAAAVAMAGAGRADLYDGAPAAPISARAAERGAAQALALATGVRLADGMPQDDYLMRVAAEARVQRALQRCDRDGRGAGRKRRGKGGGGVLWAAETVATTARAPPPLTAAALARHPRLPPILLSGPSLLGDEASGREPSAEHYVRRIEQSWLPASRTTLSLPDARMAWLLRTASIGGGHMGNKH